MARRKKELEDEQPSTNKTESSGSTQTNQTFAKGNTNMTDSTIIELDMNIADYEDFEVLPAGEYPGECTTAEVRVSDKGNQYFYTMWKVDPEDYPADYDRANNPDGSVMNYSRLQVPSADNRRSITAVKKFMTAIGLPLKTSTINASDWVGKKAKLVVAVSEYNGEPRNEIRAVESLDA